MSRNWLAARFAAEAGLLSSCASPAESFPERGQSVALLFEAGGFADPVGHEAHQARGQFWHFLHQFGKCRSRKSQERGRRLRLDRVTVNCFILENGSTPVTSPASQIKYEGFAAKFAAPLKLALKNHEHGIRRIALARVDVARLEMHLVRLADEPVDLIVGQIREAGTRRSC